MFGNTYLMDSTCMERWTWIPDDDPDPLIGHLCVHLWNHVFEGLHDPRTFRFLVVRETSGDNDDGCQDDTEVQLQTTTTTTTTNISNNFRGWGWFNYLASHECMIMHQDLDTSKSALDTLMSGIVYVWNFNHYNNFLVYALSVTPDTVKIIIVHVMRDAVTCMHISTQASCIVVRNKNSSEQETEKNITSQPNAFSTARSEPRISHEVSVSWIIRCQTEDWNMRGKIMIFLTSHWIKQCLLVLNIVNNVEPRVHV